MQQRSAPARIGLPANDEEHTTQSDQLQPPVALSLPHSPGVHRQQSAPASSAPSPEAPPNTPEAAARKWMGLVRRACYAGVQQALREGWAPLNTTDAVGYTALMRCCVSGQLLEVILGCPECDVNLSRASDGSTALLLAARHRSARTVHALLKRGAILSRDLAGCSALHRAAANPDPAVVRVLLAAGADPCARDRDGRCPLATAMLHRNQASAMALLEWQQSWAARHVLRAATEEQQHQKPQQQHEEAEGGADGEDAPREVGAAVGGCGGVGCGGGTSRTGGAPSASISLDSLPDDCLEHILTQLSALPEANKDPVPTSSEGSEAADAAATGGGAISPAAIITSVAASVVGSPHRRPAPRRLAGVGRCGPGGAPSPAGGVASSVLRMSGVCARFRAVCRRRAIAAWLAVEGLNLPVACFHPQGQMTTLLHVAAAEGMEEAAEMLLRRGAQPLARDSCGRMPLQVARGRASLLAKLVTAQANALEARAVEEQQRAPGSTPAGGTSDVGSAVHVV